MTAIIAMVLVSAFFLGPFGWRIWLDTRQARADAIRADIRAAVNRRLRGESVLSVLVVPRSLWHAGRIVLSVPSGYEWLVEAVWHDVLDRAPAGYDVVLKGRDAHAGAGRSDEAAARALPRAA